MRRYKTILYNTLYLVFSLLIMIAIYGHIHYSFRTYEADINVADSLRWSLYQGIYIAGIMPVVFAFLYLPDIRKVTDIQYAVRAGSRCSIIWKQEIYIMAVSVVNAVVNFVELYICSAVFGDRLYKFDSYNSLFYRVTGRTINMSALTVYMIIIYYMVMQLFFVLNCTLLVFAVTSKKTVICLCLALVEVLEWQRMGLAVHNSNCLYAVSLEEPDYMYMAKILALSTCVVILTVLVYKNREFR